MNFKQIQQLIKFVSKTDVNEVTIENKDFKINIKGRSFSNEATQPLTQQPLPTPQIQSPVIVPEHPTAVMSILGTDDFNSLYNGVEFAGVLYYLSAADTHQFWIDYNNTDPNPIEIELPNISTNDGSTVTKRIWENGDACVSVVELRVNGGDHDWPGWKYGY